MLPTTDRKDHSEGQCFMCDRCQAREIGTPADLINAAYLIDDPAAHTGALCPACALDDDPRHVPGSWLLTWAT